MDEKTLKAVREACEKDPTGVLNLLLETQFTPETLLPREGHSRLEDDTRFAQISIMIGPDSDRWIQIIADPDPNERNLSQRFRMPIIGGGQSPYTFIALGILGHAIARDNAEHPQSLRSRG